MIQTIQGHPLTLQQFITAFNRTRLTTEKFLQHFREETAKMLEKSLFKTEKGVSAIAAISINISRLIEQGEETQIAVEMLKRLCHLEAETIPLKVVQIVCADFDEMDIESGIQQLKEMSLVIDRESPDGVVVGIHSMI